MIEILQKAGIAVAGLAGSFFVGKWVVTKVRSYRDSKIVSAKKLITDIKDPDVQVIVKALCRLAAKNLPDYHGPQKFDSVVGELQKIIPDWLIADKEIELLVEETYEKFKSEFREIQ